MIFNEHPTGLSAVNDLLVGKVDVATAAEFLFVTKSFCLQPTYFAFSLPTPSFSVYIRSGRGGVRS